MLKKTYIKCWVQAAEYIVILHSIYYKLKYYYNIGNDVQTNGRRRLTTEFNNTSRLFTQVVEFSAEVIEKIASQIGTLHDRTTL